MINASIGQCKRASDFMKEIHIFTQINLRI